MGRTIRTCSVTAGLLALTVATVAEAKRSPTPLGWYARARVADGLRDAPVAVAAYRAALTAAPDDRTVAFQSYREAIEAGDLPLALRAARALERAGTLPPDAAVLFYVAAVRSRDWRTAKTQLAAVARAPGLALLAPLFAPWLDEASTGLITANAYAAENAALLALARGRTDEGLIAVRSLWPTDPDRAQSLRLAAASLLTDRRQRAEAKQLIIGQAPAAVAVRDRIDRRKRLRLSIATPASAAAFVLSRMANDLLAEGVRRQSVTLARFAAFADPGNAQVALTLAAALASDRREGPALAVLDRVLRHPVLGDDAHAMRIGILEQAGQDGRATLEAAARATDVAGHVRVAELALRQGRPAAAAIAYRAALTDNATDVQLLYSTGNALSLAGDWVGARPLLERALQLSPDDPNILNSLGYGLVERGEEQARAIGLLERAAKLAPDSAAIADSLGWADYRRGRLGPAIAALERAAALDDGEAEIGEHLGDVYWAAGRRIDARYAWRAARLRAPEAAYARIDAKLDRGLP